MTVRGAFGSKVPDAVSQIYAPWQMEMFTQCAFVLFSIRFPKSAGWFDFENETGGM